MAYYRFITPIEIEYTTVFKIVSGQFTEGNPTLEFHIYITHDLLEDLSLLIMYSIANK